MTITQANAFQFPEPLPGADWVRIAVVGGDESVTSRLDEQVPTVDSASYGGHEAVVRPGRRPLTPWRGPGQPILKFGIVLDAAPTEHYIEPQHPVPEGIGKPVQKKHVNTPEDVDTIEPECRTLEVMAGGLVRGDPEPPRLTITGRMVPHSAGFAAGNEWVIAPSGIEWGDAIRREPDGRRVRQQATLTFWLYVDSGAIARIGSRQPPPAYKVFVTTKTVNTYLRVAAKKLGSAKLGKRLAKLNGARDPGKKLTVGTRVRLPTAHTLKLWQREYGIH